MDEIGVQALRPGRDVLQDRVRRGGIERVPAHMRDAEGGIGRLERADLAGDPVEAGRFAMLQPAGGQKLHADADAEKRTSLVEHGGAQGLDHAGDVLKSAQAIGEGADARQHDMIGASRRRRDRR